MEQITYPTVNFAARVMAMHGAGDNALEVPIGSAGFVVTYMNFNSPGIADTAEVRYYAHEWPTMFIRIWHAFVDIGTDFQADWSGFLVIEPGDKLEVVTSGGGFYASGYRIFTPSGARI